MLCYRQPPSVLVQDHHLDSVTKVTIRKHEQGHLRAEEEQLSTRGARGTGLDPDHHLIEEIIDQHTEVIPMDLNSLIIMIETTLKIATNREIPRKIKITMETEIHIAET